MNSEVFMFEYNGRKYAFNKDFEQYENGSINGKYPRPSSIRPSIKNVEYLSINEILNLFKNLSLKDLSFLFKCPMEGWVANFYAELNLWRFESVW